MVQYAQMGLDHRKRSSHSAGRLPRFDGNGQGLRPDGAGPENRGDGRIGYQEAPPLGHRNAGNCWFALAGGQRDPGNVWLTGALPVAYPGGGRGKTGPGTDLDRNPRCGNNKRWNLHRRTEGRVGTGRCRTGKGGSVERHRIQCQIRHDQEDRNRRRESVRGEGRGEGGEGDGGNGHTVLAAESHVRRDLYRRAWTQADQGVLQCAAACRHSFRSRDCDGSEGRRGLGNRCPRSRPRYRVPHPRRRVDYRDSRIIQPRRTAVASSAEYKQNAGL